MSRKNNFHGRLGCYCTPTYCNSFLNLSRPFFFLFFILFILVLPIANGAENITATFHEKSLCTAQEDCSDNSTCTTDSCLGEPSFCSNTPIESCFSGDGCCPSSCTYGDDNDCGEDVVCGDAICSRNETQSECCKDCGCEDGYECSDDGCKKTMITLARESVEADTEFKKSQDKLASLGYSLEKRSFVESAEGIGFRYSYSNGAEEEELSGVVQDDLNVVLLSPKLNFSFLIYTSLAALIPLLWALAVFHNNKKERPIDSLKKTNSILPNPQNNPNKFNEKKNNQHAYYQPANPHFINKPLYLQPIKNQKQNLAQPSARGNLAGGFILNQAARQSTSQKILQQNRQTQPQKILERNRPITYPQKNMMQKPQNPVSRPPAAKEYHSLIHEHNPIKPEEPMHSLYEDSNQNNVKPTHPLQPSSPFVNNKMQQKELITEKNSKRHSLAFQKLRRMRLQKRLKN